MNTGPMEEVGETKQMIEPSRSDGREREEG